MPISLGKKSEKYGVPIQAVEDVHISVISIYALADLYGRVRWRDQGDKNIGLFDYFFSGWFAHLCFGLGRGLITPPDPAMALTDRKDLN